MGKFYKGNMTVMLSSSPPSPPRHHNTPSSPHPPSSPPTSGGLEGLQALSPLLLGPVGYALGCLHTGLAYYSLKFLKL